MQHMTSTSYAALKQNTQNISLARLRLQETALTEFLILPSGHAGMQSLVTVMDTIVRAGGSRVRVVRLEARP